MRSSESDYVASNRRRRLLSRTPRPTTRPWIADGEPEVQCFDHLIFLPYRPLYAFRRTVHNMYEVQIIVDHFGAGLEFTSKHKTKVEAYEIAVSPAFEFLIKNYPSDRMGK